MADGGLGKRAHRDEDLESEFDFGSETKRSSWRDDPITKKPSNLVNIPTHSTGMPSKQLVVAERDKEEWRSRRYHYLAMDAYSRHKALVNQYLLSCGQGIEHFKRSTENDRNDYAVLTEEHRFLWEPNEKPETWEKRLAKAYYDKLFKEYAIADLSRYKENKFAMRWRIEKEVCEGEGQFVCGSKHCSRKEELTSWEVNFSYLEQGEKKNALVKLRLCPKCSKKLNYHKKCKVWGGGTKPGKKRVKDKRSKRRHKERDGKRWTEKPRHHSPVSKDRKSRDNETESDTDSGSSSGEGEEEGADPQAAAEGSSDPRGNEVWKKPAETLLEKSKVEEFDDYFKDMLL